MIYNKRRGKDFGFIPADAVLCDRSSPYGNPFVVGIHGHGGVCCDKFEVWLRTGQNFGNPAAYAARRQRVLDALPGLKGKDLVCWCAPKRCHCETLERLANET